MNHPLRRRPDYRKGSDGIYRDLAAPKERAKRRQVEDGVQVSIIEAIELAVPEVDVRAVPNESGNLTKRTRGRLKHIGRKAGTLDLIVAWNGRAGLSGGVGFIEVKPPGYTPSMVSKEQQSLLARWTEWGLNVGIASTPEEALDLLRRWGAPVRAVVAA